MPVVGKQYCMFLQPPVLNTIPSKTLQYHQVGGCIYYYKPFRRCIILYFLSSFHNEIWNICSTKHGQYSSCVFVPSDCCLWQAVICGSHLWPPVTAEPQVSWGEEVVRARFFSAGFQKQVHAVTFSVCALRDGIAETLTRGNSKDFTCTFKRQQNDTGRKWLFLPRLETFKRSSDCRCPWYLPLTQRSSMNGDVQYCTNHIYR